MGMREGCNETSADVARHGLRLGLAILSDRPRTPAHIHRHLFDSELRARQGLGSLGDAARDRDLAG